MDSMAEWNDMMEKEDLPNWKTDYVEKLLDVDQPIAGAAPKTNVVRARIDPCKSIVCPTSRIVRVPRGVIYDGAVESTGDPVPTTSKAVQNDNSLEQTREKDDSQLTDPQATIIVSGGKPKKLGIFASPLDFKHSRTAPPQTGEIKKRRMESSGSRAHLKRSCTEPRLGKKNA